MNLELNDADEHSGETHRNRSFSSTSTAENENQNQYEPRDGYSGLDSAVDDYRSDEDIQIEKTNAAQYMSEIQCDCNEEFSSNSEMKIETVPAIDWSQSAVQEMTKTLSDSNMIVDFHESELQIGGESDSRRAPNSESAEEKDHENLRDEMNEEQNFNMKNKNVGKTEAAVNRDRSNKTGTNENLKSDDWCDCGLLFNENLDPSKVYPHAVYGAVQYPFAERARNYNIAGDIIARKENEKNRNNRDHQRWIKDLQKYSHISSNASRPKVRYDTYFPYDGRDDFGMTWTHTPNPYKKKISNQNLNYQPDCEAVEGLPPQKNLNQYAKKNGLKSNYQKPTIIKQEESVAKPKKEKHQLNEYTSANNAANNFNETISAESLLSLELLKRISQPTPFDRYKWSYAKRMKEKERTRFLANKGFVYQNYRQAIENARNLDWSIQNGNRWRPNNYAVKDDEKNVHIQKNSVNEKREAINCKFLNSSDCGAKKTESPQNMEKEYEEQTENPLQTSTKENTNNNEEKESKTWIPQLQDVLIPPLTKKEKTAVLMNKMREKLFRKRKLIEGYDQVEEDKRRSKGIQANFYQNKITEEKNVCTSDNFKGSETSIDNLWSKQQSLSMTFGLQNSKSLTISNEFKTDETEKLAEKHKELRNISQQFNTMLQNMNVMYDRIMGDSKENIRNRITQSSDLSLSQHPQTVEPCGDGSTTSSNASKLLYGNGNENNVDNLGGLTQQNRSQNENSLKNGEDDSLSQGGNLNAWIDKLKIQYKLDRYKKRQSGFEVIIKEDNKKEEMQLEAFRNFLSDFEQDYNARMEARPIPDPKDAMFCCGKNLNDCLKWCKKLQCAGCKGCGGQFAPSKNKERQTGEMANVNAFDTGELEKTADLSKPFVDAIDLNKSQEINMHSEPEYQILFPKDMHYTDDLDIFEKHSRVDKSGFNAAQYKDSFLDALENDKDYTQFLGEKIISKPAQDESEKLSDSKVGSQSLDGDSLEFDLLKLLRNQKNQGNATDTNENNELTDSNYNANSGVYVGQVFDSYMDEILGGMFCHHETLDEWIDWLMLRGEGYSLADGGIHAKESAILTQNDERPTVQKQQLREKMQSFKERVAEEEMMMQERENQRFMSAILEFNTDYNIAMTELYGEVDTPHSSNQDTFEDEMEGIPEEITIEEVMSQVERPISKHVLEDTHSGGPVNIMDFPPDRSVYTVTQPDFETIRIGDITMAVDNQKPVALPEPTDFGDEAAGEEVEVDVMGVEPPRATLQESVADEPSEPEGNRKPKPFNMGEPIMLPTDQTGMSILMDAKKPKGTIDPDELMARANEDARLRMKPPEEERQIPPPVKTVKPRTSTDNLKEALGKKVHYETDFSEFLQKPAVEGQGCNFMIDGVSICEKYCGDSGCENCAGGCQHNKAGGKTGNSINNNSTHDNWSFRQRNTNSSIPMSFEQFEEEYQNLETQNAPKFTDDGSEILDDTSFIHSLSVRWQ